MYILLSTAFKIWRTVGFRCSFSVHEINLPLLCQVTFKTDYNYRLFKFIFELQLNYSFANLRNVEESLLVRHIVANNVRILIG